jgi:general secretion pathway protein D
MKHASLALGAVLGLASCEQPPAPVVTPLPPLTGSAGAAAPRIDGSVGTTDARAAPQVSLAPSQTVRLSLPREAASGPPVTLDFADTDIRDVAAQILGTMLKLTYTIDPGVHGTATLRTATPLATSQLLPTLAALLAQNGATLLESDGIYRVAVAPGGAPAPAAPTGSPGFATSNDVGGSVVVQLRYASADDLAKVLQPFAGSNARIIADPARNVLLVSGDAGARIALISLIQAFDIDLLAGQSYALLPVTTGDAKDFAAAFQDALRGQGGGGQSGGLAGVIRVLPMSRMNAVLVVASQPRYIADARRIYQLVDRAQRETVRSWHVYYLQNSHADDVAYLLQRAFTPNDVTAQPSAGPTAPGRGIQQTSALGNGLSGNGLSGNGLASSGFGGNALGGATQAGGIGNSATTPAATTATPTAAATPPASANPLLGGLEPGTGGTTDTTTMRIIPNPQNNAVLIFATAHEEDTVEAMLHKVDILPLQVRIDATIAEVTLNDQLQYGTQFFFKSGGINGILNNAATALGNPVATVLSTSFPGFVLSGSGQGGAPIALQALQAVTTVNVLSSPELLVLDNQPARLQVGDLVPYLTGSSQSTVANSAVINSVNYQPTGVIMNVTPRVNSGGLVTLDISQEVSGINTSVTASTTGISSPTFSERQVTSRVVVQDGQTIGLAGLITDNVTRGNSGLPFLKDIPLLGILAGTQSNTRTRTELLVLITPHVLHDQHDARILTEDLRDQLINAAALPTSLQTLAPSGSDDPNRHSRDVIQQLQPKQRP